MKIRDKTIGDKTFIIAEIGGNHNGNFETALEIIDQAKEANVDAVKFQTYEATKYIDASVEAMGHVRALHKTQQERFKSLQFSDTEWEKLISYCNENELIFFSTATDNERVDFIDQYVDVYKIQSGDVTNIPLIRHIVKKNKPIIMSVGMATENEISRALEEIPKDMVVLLHCVSIYPTSAENVCLQSIPYLNKRFSVPVGYSDHTMNSNACIAAVALGAVVIERHFTNNKNQPVGDHKFSATCQEMHAMIESIREIEQMRGIFTERLSAPELKMKYAMRRGLALTKDVPAGTTISEQILIPIRPEKGISPMDYDWVIGKKTKIDLKKGDFIEKDNLIS